MTTPLLIGVFFLTSWLKHGVLGWVGSYSCLISAYSENYRIKHELQAHKLWGGKDSFKTVHKIIDAVLDTESDVMCTPLLKREDPSFGMDRSLSIPNNYESLFASLFDPNRLVQTTSTLSNTSFPYSREQNFRIDFAYRGSDFCGWQKQPRNKSLPSVEQTMQEWLEHLNQGRKVTLRVCGRTDAGVHAIGQVCRFRTRNTNLEPQDIMHHMAKMPIVENGSLRILRVSRVSQDFHPTFAALNRAYAYVLDLGEVSILSESDISVLNGMLQRLEGLELDFYGMSYGKTTPQSTLCTLHYARAAIVTRNEARALCIQLVGDRFLRRMIRILVATALREVLDKQGLDRLLDIIVERDRSVCAKPVPPHGLVFVGASFDDR